MGLNNQTMMAGAIKCREGNGEATQISGEITKSPGMSDDDCIASDATSDSTFSNSNFNNNDSSSVHDDDGDNNVSEKEDKDGAQEMNMGCP